MDREEKVDLARDLTKKRLEMIPNLPQYTFLSGKKLKDCKFIELPDNVINFALSIGIYEKC